MYSVKGDGILIYSDVSPTESGKASGPKLTLKDNAAGSLEITLPPGNAGYDILQPITSEFIVYRDNKPEWYGRIISEKMDFWNNRVLTCEGELAYLNDTTQPQRKYPEGTTVRDFLTSVLEEHNKRYDDERYKFHIGELVIYNADETLPEIVTDYENTLDCINTNIIERFECHIRIEHINGKIYMGFVKDEALFSENTQTIRFGENLLDFTKNKDLTDLATVIIPRGAKVEKDSDEDSDAFDTFISLNDIPSKNVIEKDELGEYRRDENGKLVHDDDNNLIYDYFDKKDENGNPVYKYEEVNGYLILEKDGDKPVIRVDVNASKDGKAVVEFLEDGEVTSKIVTDGLYADVYLKNQNGDFYSLKEQYGWIEQVVDFSEAKDSIELLKNTCDYIKEHRFDGMELEVSAVDLRYLMDDAEPIKILDRMRCISYPHGMNTLFTVTELSIQLDRPDSACYTLEKTLQYSPKSSSTLSGSMSAVTAELKSPHSSVLTQAKSDADKILREKTNGYISLITDTEGGRHSEALVISSGKDYKRSSHFWIWNVNGLGHYTETGDPDYIPSTDNENEIGQWGKYALNVGITMDGAIVANRITVGHMSADRVRTGVLMSQDGNVVWNLNANDTYVEELKKTYPGGSLTIKKGSIDLGTVTDSAGVTRPAFSVDNNGTVYAERGKIGGFDITATDIHNDAMALDRMGLHMFCNPNIDVEDYKRYDNSVGFLGISYWNENPSYKSLAMNMENEGSAIWWAYRQRSSDDTFTVKLLYAAEDFDKYEQDKLYVECPLEVYDDINLNNNIAYNFNIDSNSGGAIGGVNGTFLLLSKEAINDDGTIDKAALYEIKIKNGFVIY